LSSAEFPRTPRLPAEQLADVHAWAERLLGGLDTPLTLLDQCGEVVWANAAWRSFEPRLRVEGHAASTVSPAELLGAALPGVLSVARGERTAFETECELGAKLTCRVRGTQVTAPALPLVIVAYVELVDSVRLQAEVSALRGELLRSQPKLAYAQRLEATGRLTDVVAHDLNNVLTSIFCFTRLAVDDSGADDPRRADLLEVLRSAENAARLTSQLLAFSRRRPSQPVQLDVNGVLTRLHSLLRRTFGERGELIVEPAAEALQVLCDPDQLDQLLFNLVMHAKDAPTVGTGTSVLAAQAIELPESGRGPAAASGDYVALSIQRAGGRRVAALEIERYSVLTAEHPSVQQDVALSACRQIVEQAQGVTLLGPHSDGPSVYVLLPRRDPRPAAEAWGRPSRMPNALRGTVLVVDDDAPLMRTMARTLASLGLRVIEAGTAESALAQLETVGGVVRPDLVVTNTLLPGMSGFALVNRLRATHARLTALYVSARLEDDAVAQQEAATAFMLKPFTGRQLALQVAALLGGEPGAGAASGSRQA